MKFKHLQADKQIEEKLWRMEWNLLINQLLYKIWRCLKKELIKMIVTI